MAILTTKIIDGIAVLTLDNPPVNAISAAVRQGLWQAVADLDADTTVRAVVLICAGRTFIAGADVREFSQTPVEPHLPDLIARIEGAAKPWVAAIHGNALGGGLEIAMGCRFRIATPDAKLGLPEVTLGVIPGASGTQRTPRLIGMQNAAQLVLSGAPIKAPQALEWGLIDAIAGDLEGDALTFIRDALTRDLPLPTAERSVPAVDDTVWQTAEKLAGKLGNAAPLDALACLKNAATLSFADAMKAERATFLRLRDSAEAAALRHIFFAERGATRPADLRDVTPRPLTRVGVIGGGTMGAGIAAACRTAGLPVVLVERDADAIARGIMNVDKTFLGAVKRGKMTEDGRQTLLDGLTGTTTYADLATCDLVIEAVFEDLAVKQQVFAQLAQVCRAEAILATNTSYLDPTLIAEGLPNPARFIGLHFFSPAHIMKLLEVVPTPNTSPETLATAFALAARLRKIPVKSGICEGFIGNRILKRYRAAAEQLVRQGVKIQAIDGAMVAYGFKMGPFAAQDLGGLDIAFLQREGARAEGQEVPETLGDILVQAGRKGQKTQGGWYDYAEGTRAGVPSPAVAALLASHISGQPPIEESQIATHLVAEMAAEGQAILSEGIAATPADIDLVKVHGYGFPRWKGGPMFATSAVPN